MSSAAPNPAIKWFYHIARVIFGGWWLYSGVMPFIDPSWQPKGQEQAAIDFTNAMLASGLFTWVKGIEVVLGFTLLFSRFMPLTVIALVPINFVVVYYNWVLEPHRGTYIAGGLTLFCTAWLVWSWRAYFWPLLAYKGMPHHDFKPHFTTLHPKGESE